MKTIGLLGGMSWESSIEYYRIINQTVQQRLGGLHSARSIMYSVEFAEIEHLQHSGQWQEAAAILGAAAQSLERAGAELLVICTNTMHKLADDIQQQISIPLLHIAAATAQSIQAQQLDTVGLLGTRFTMEEDFYIGVLREQYGLHVLIPPPAEREIVHRVIYNELCVGTIHEPSRAAYREIIAHLVEQGAQGIILGCTEIGLLVHAEDSPVPLFDTTVLHAQAAVDAALAEVEKL
jgi:aspartate racemase